MTRYKCPDCGWTGEEDECIEHLTTYEDLYDTPFPGSEHITILQCPICMSEDLEELDDDDEEDDDDADALRPKSLPRQ